MMCKICSTDRSNPVYSSEICAEKCKPGSICQKERKCAKLSPTGCDTCLRDDECVYNKDSKTCLFGETAPMGIPIVYSYVFEATKCPAESLNVCSTYTDCSSCMAKESETCVFDKKDG